VIDKERPSDPVTIAADLRSRTDAELLALFRNRPDLLHPVPSDLDALAARASSRPSVFRAIEGLSTVELHVLAAFSLNGERRELIPSVSPEQLHDATQRLIELGLMRRDTAAAPRVVGAAAELTRSITGLGPPIAQAIGSLDEPRIGSIRRDVAATLTASSYRGVISEEGTERARLTAMLAHPAVLAALWEQASEPAREAMGLLRWGPAQTSLTQATRPARADTASSPVDWLLAHGLLIPVSETMVMVTEEVGLMLRGGHLFPHDASTPPPLMATQRDPALIDRAAAAAADRCCRAVETLLEEWSVSPPPVLRAGGLGVRELRRVAQLLNREETEAALLIEVAAAGGLVASDGAADPVWLPTRGYDEWLELPAAWRWSALVTAWLTSPRQAGAVGQRDDKDKVIAALGSQPTTPADTVITRRQTLALLAEAPPGTAPDGTWMTDTALWRRPIRMNRTGSDAVPWTLRDADVLGVCGLGALSTPGRALLCGDTAADAAAALAPLLPTPIGYIMLQADLTAVAPGPLETDLSRELALLATVESTGGATVYRFTETSIRRALDAGRTSADIQAFLTARSTTAVPQPLAYLVDDAARRHGRIRIGTLGTYLRCEDPSLLAELAADRRLTALGLRLLAPTVLACGVGPELVLDQLRGRGYSPMPEGPDGAIRLRRADHRRGSTAMRRPSAVAADQPNPALIEAAVRALRAGDRVRRVGSAAHRAGQPDGAIPRSSTAAALAAVRGAIRDGVPLWIGYVNTEGAASQRVIEPLGTEGGYLTAYDHLREEVRTFAVHRITGVAQVPAGQEL
jgi:hypothetical protein